MDSSSIISGFQFDSYKINKIEFSTDENISTLVSKENDYDVRFSFAFRDALKYENISSSRLYVTGLRVSVTIISRKNNITMASGVFEITGLFSVIGSLTIEQEESLAVLQGPAILFPYIRAVVSQTLSNAGFVVPIIPLLNINTLAKHAKVKIIEGN